MGQDWYPTLFWIRCLVSERLSPYVSPKVLPYDFISLLQLFLSANTAFKRRAKRRGLCVPGFDAFGHTNGTVLRVIIGGLRLPRQEAFEDDGVPIGAGAARRHVGRGASQRDRRQRID